jgi:hypothetical protein
MGSDLTSRRICRISLSKSILGLPAQGYEFIYWPFRFMFDINFHGIVWQIGPLSNSVGILTNSSKSHYLTSQIRTKSSVRCLLLPKIGVRGARGMVFGE